MKRYLTGLLALCLLCGLPVSAASRDNLTLSCQERGGEVRLTLEGLDHQVYALQLELALAGDCPDAIFEAGSGRYTARTAMWRRTGTRPL